ncbi:MAG: RNase adapter RapZ [Gammaproteobacteria bacterium]|nr:RNase adapter RapZ [Gammaproteobacteria bacterium]
MKLIIVSGMSGAGKSIALNSLEDMGAYCIDNLPVNLLPAMAEQTGSLKAACIAIGVDARNIGLHDVPALLQTRRNSGEGCECEILFLEASDSTLITRFSETRRKHPLTTPSIPLAEAIKKERELLKSLSSCADIHIDTTHMHLYQLRDLIRLRVKLQASQGMSLLFRSFGFKYGIPQDADFVFDVRCLPNPHWESKLRMLTGKDQPVIDFLHAQPQVRQMLEHTIQFLAAWVPQFEADNRNYLTIAIGCTGGQHRSVYITDELAKYFGQQREGVLVRHRELVNC